MIRLNYGGDTSFEEMLECHRRYKQYLLDIKHQIPKEVFEYAMADGHYDPSNSRCIHDAKLDVFELRERVDGDSRSLTINISLISKDDRNRFQFTYEGVKYYRLEKEPLTGVLGDFFEGPLGSHGDCLIDEIELSDEGLVVHAIEFAWNATWWIHCETFNFTVSPL